MDKEQIKQLLERIDPRPLMEHIKGGDVVFLVGVIILSLAVGLYLGYSPENILSWLGL